MNPYKVLGISKNATREEIKTAYRKLAVKYHPDKNPDPVIESAFREITEAYNMIRNPEKRALNDRGGPTRQQVEGALIQNFLSITKEIPINKLKYKKLIREMRNNCSGQISNLKREMITLYRAKEESLDLLGRFEGENIFTVFIKGQVREIRSNIKNIRGGLVVNVKSKTYLKKVKFNREIRQEVMARFDLGQSYTDSTTSAM